MGARGLSCGDNRCTVGGGGEKDRSKDLSGLIRTLSQTGRNGPIVQGEGQLPFVV